jgi:CDP-diacylglycerol--serine O-phosphatidyltransferase
MDYAFYCIMIAASFDLFDGLIARLLKAQSAFGKEFDSICDVVSFGVAPAVISIRVIEQYIVIGNHIFGLVNVYYLAPILFALVAGIRLAWFNTDEKQTNSFRGLPSPAAGMALACIALYWAELFEIQNVVSIVSIASLVFASLMLIPIPLLSLKLKDKNSLLLAIALLLVAIPLIIFFQFSSIVLIVLAYILFSLLIRFLHRMF